jgi:integrase
MRKRRREQYDGIYGRPDSPYWWVCIPDGRGGTTRRPTGIRADEDPRKERARIIRAQLILQAQAESRRPAEDPAGPTFDELMEAYLTGPSRKKRSHARDFYSVKRLLPVFTGRRLPTLTRADALHYVALREDQGVQPGTIAKELRAFSAALNWAREALGWEVPNPFTGKSCPREPEGRVRWITRAEAATLLQAAQWVRAAHLADFILLGLHTGMRRGEMLGLEWRRVDLQAGLLYLEAAHQKSGKRGSIPLNATARTAIVSRARFRAQHCPDSPWVFCTREGRRIGSIKTAFARACALAGLEDFHPHDLRHTFAAWLVQAGVPLTEIRDLLRHSTIRMTERYAHLAPEGSRAAVQAIDWALDEGVNFTHVKFEPPKRRRDDEASG